ncbi:MAG: peptidoglycan DD-metalloendopeptidase family protein [Patescibacteria group bacterium]
MKTGIGFLGGRFWPKIKRPLKAVGGFLFGFGILPIYKGYLFFKRQLLKIYIPSGNKLWDIITNRYVIHGIILILGLLVVTNNLQARWHGFRDEEFGKKTILYQLVGGQELGLVEESIDNSPAGSNISSYLGYESGVTSNTPKFSNQGEIQDITATTQGGTALIKPEISPGNETAGPARAASETYTVQQGDTIGSIAEKFGISVNTVLWENKLTERSYIRPGDKLTILPVSGIKHKVVRGENINKIAQLYGIEVAQVMIANDLDVNSSLSIGQELIIPGGKKLPVYAPTPKPVVRSYVGSAPASATPSSTQLQWPTSGRRITQYFGWKHGGLDIDGDYSSPIYAAESGTISRYGWGGWNNGYGNVLAIDHGGGLSTLYAHMSKLFVKLGDTVTRGQTIGMMGTTGHSTGTHLHFEVRINGKTVNPLSYIK